MTESIKLDDSRAWNYHKADENFKKKVISFYVLCLLCLIPILNFILVPIFAFKITGYFLSNTRARVFKPDSTLADWNDKKHIGIGFKAMIANIIIAIPVNMIYYILIKPIIDPSNASLLPFIFLITLILFLIPPIYYAIAVLAFVTDFKIKSFFNMKAIKCIIKNDLFISYLLKIFLYGILYMLVMVMAGITIIGILAVPYIIFRFLAAISDIQAQFIRYAFKIGQKK